MKPDVYSWISTLAEDYGVDAAAEVAAFEAKHVQAVKEFVENENIDCDYTVTNAVDVQLDDEHYEKLKVGFEQLLADGCSPTKQARYVGPDQAESVSMKIESRSQPLIYLIYVALRGERRTRLFHL